MPHFPLDAVIHKQLQLVGALASGDWSVAQAIRVAAAGRHPLHLLHSHTLPLAEAAHAIEMLAGQVPGETPIHITLVTGLTP
jgi:threonine dehydrogenase-like Zn-dependent dehydrogenase